MEILILPSIIFIILLKAKIHWMYLSLNYNDLHRIRFGAYLNYLLSGGTKNVIKTDDGSKVEIGNLYVIFIPYIFKIYKSDKPLIVVMKLVISLMSLLCIAIVIYILSST